ncbi:hypothetical protein J6590_026027 [Homalodisca vitripennis]|uniref:Uncharacterized protein n=1 Tax=Homalodisca liturata TaxID=320908 RepID=A0A1B6IJW2_9HEMI|nr:hypothetical protein J6590_026027 [Homalodisca vitripennis]
MFLGNLVKICNTLMFNNTFTKTGVVNILSTPSKTSFHSSVAKLHNTNDERGMPAVYYYQNPFHWLRIKWQLLKLKQWDKEFNETEFTRGSTYAISSVTSIVSYENYDDLKGMLTPFALSKLRRDILVLWNDEIVKNIGLTLDDIKLAVPTRVHIRTGPRAYKRLCDIDMWYMAMKWRDLNALLIMDIVARFTRDYTHTDSLSDWTISFFELRKYHVQNYNTQQRK